MLAKLFFRHRPRYQVAFEQSRANIGCIMAERDANQDALRQVEHATDSQPVSGEELLESEELKRQLREARREANQPTGGREDRKN